MKVISVPLSNSAMDRLYYDKTEDGDLLELFLTDNDFDILISTGFIQEVNSSLSINIDEYEDEEITEQSMLGKIESITQKYESSSILFSKMHQLILVAIEKNTGIFFFF